MTTNHLLLHDTIDPGKRYSAKTKDDPLNGARHVDLSDELKVFLVEAYDNLDAVEQSLVDFERNPEELEVLNAIFRAIHSMKGNAGFLGLGSLETICHRAEAILDRARKGAPLTHTQTSGLLGGVDCIRTLLQAVESHGDDAAVDVTATLKELNSLLE
jgi:two-component system chemotaxis sensor kinase CheA